MSWLAYIMTAWLAFAVFGGMALYIGYGFAMSAKRTKGDGSSPAHVVLVDNLLLIPIIVLDGLYNALVLTLLCLDHRLQYAFGRYQYNGKNIWFFEVVTERLSRYNEDKTQWAYHRWIARTVAPFLDGKDPKGWHIRGEHQRINGLHGDAPVAPTNTV